MQFIVPTLFGLEGLAGDELRRMNMENVRVEDRRVLFTGDERALAKANICLRTGERIMIVLAQFQAKTFEELFQGVYHTNLEDFIGRDDQFPVKGHCLNSQLMSVSDCQAIIKKAASRRLGEKYGIAWLPETGIKYQLHFTILNDKVTWSLSTVKCSWNFTPVSGSQLTPYFSPNRREAAFLMMAWQSDTLISWLLRQ